MSLRFASAVIAILAITATDIAAARDCGFAPAFKRADERGTRSVQVYEGKADPLIGGVRPLLFVSDLKVNTDGTRISYSVVDPAAKTVAINHLYNAMPAAARNKSNLIELQGLAKAGWLPTKRTWQLLSAAVIEKNKKTGTPCGEPGGYLVSSTSDVAIDGGWARVGDCDQSKWIDALDVAGLVLPRPVVTKNRRVIPTEFDRRDATNRTPVVAMTLDTNHRIALGIVGDKGPVDELGEASVAMNRTLNGLAPSDVPKSNIDAIRRFQAPRSVILLFPGAANRVARPLTGATTSAAAGALFRRWGGQARLERCLTTEIPNAL